MSKDVIHIRLRELMNIAAYHTIRNSNGEYMIRISIINLLEKVIISDQGTTNFQALAEWAALLAEAE